jgi:hypothetical protein
MRDVIDLILRKEVGIDDPRCVLNNLVDPITMLNEAASQYSTTSAPFAIAHGLVALLRGKDRRGLVLAYELIRDDANQEVDIWEEELGLP